MKPLWTTVDLIDLHAFLQADEETLRQGGEAALVKRDRIMYLTKIAPRQGEGQEMPARLLVRRWLDLRRLQRSGHDRGGEPLPGQLWSELAGLGRWLALLIGLATGTGLAGSLLFYSGVTPINVSAYFGLFVLLQLGLLVLLLLLGLGRRWGRRPMASSLLYRSLARLALLAAEGLHRRLHRRLGSRTRLDLAALAGSVRATGERAALLAWPAFALAQVVGVGFNLGVLAATLSRVIFADIAFAWQSTLNLAPETVAYLVRWLALPWAWFVGQAYPDLAQIRGSQMVLKEGVGHLASADLAAWWPFLCWAVFVYGLLPRLALAWWGWRQQRRELDRLHFAGLEYRPLLQRLLVPRVETDGLVGAERPMVSPSTSDEKGATSPPAADAPVAGDPTPTSGQDRVTPATAMVASPLAGRWLVLIPDELYDDLLQEDLAAVLLPWTLGASMDRLRIGVPGENGTEWLARIAQAAKEGQLAGVLLLQEAWQPPLKEHAGLLAEARRAAGSQPPILVALIGKPRAGGLLTPVSTDHLHIWQRSIQALGDAGCRAEALVRS